MALTDRKVTTWTQPVTSLADRPQMTASELKAAFDSNTNQLQPALNGVIDDLTGTTGADNVGVSAIAGVTGTTVQAMLAALKALIDLCDTTTESDAKFDLKADKTTTDKLIKTVSLNADTGVFTFTTDDGTQTTIDTMLEKIPVSCYLDGQEFVLVLDDGTEQRADLSDFLTPTEFTDSSTIDFSVSGTTVTANIKNGSVTLQMLENTIISTLQGYMIAAQTAAGNAATSESNAGVYKDQAQGAATNAAFSASEAGAKSTLSQSWAIGGTGTRIGEDVNNSKYFSQVASTQATNAQSYANTAMEQADAAEGYKNTAVSAAERAEQAADDAEAIAGGDFVPNSQKGIAGGVATLGSDGILSIEQRPEIPVMYVNITQSDSVYTTDKTAQEIYEAFESGFAVYAVVDETTFVPLYVSQPGTAVFAFSLNGKDAKVTITGETVQYSVNDIDAGKIAFTPTDTLISNNVQDAIEEVDSAKIDAPASGTSGQFLQKTEGGQEWADWPKELPDGGAAGSVLTRASSGAPSWDTIDKEMLSDELAAELDAKAEAADLTAEVATRASADTALDTRVTALESEVPQKAEVYYTTYSGTGGARTFTLGFTPKLVIVTCSDYNDCAPAAPLAVPQGQTVYYNSYALATLSGNTLSIKETGGRNLTGHSYAILAVV